MYTKLAVKSFFFTLDSVQPNFNKGSMVLVKFLRVGEDFNNMNLRPFLRMQPAVEYDR